MKALLALLTVLAAGAALIGIGEATRPSNSPAAAAGRALEQVPVLTSTAVCPDIRQADGELVTRVSVGVAGTGAAAPGAAVVAHALSRRGGNVRVPLAGPGSAVTDLGLSRNGEALVVEASGDLAPGLEVEALTRSASGISRGLAGMRCTAAAVDQWFLGGGTRPGEVSVLVLANPGRVPALVDVTVFGENAAAGQAPGRGLVVPAQGRRLVSLNALAPDLASLAVRVQARRGRVAAGVLTSRADGRLAKGLEWAAAVQPPAVRAVVPGFVPGSGPRRVLIANPTQHATTVSLQITGVDGQRSPAALSGLPVLPRRVLAVDLSDLSAQGAFAVTVRSAGAPVLAAGLLVDGEGPVTDLAFTASAATLQRSAMIADLTLAPAVESVLSLSAVDGRATVVVTAVAVPGNEADIGPPVTIVIPGGATRTLVLSGFVATGATARLAVQVEVLAGSVPVFAARFLQENGPDGPFTTSLALRSARGPVQRPQVAADPAAGRIRPAEDR